MRILVCAMGYSTLKKNEILNFALDQAKALRSQGHDVRISAIDLRSIKHLRKMGTYMCEIEGMLASISNFPIGKVPFYYISVVIRKWCAEKSYKMVTSDGWIPDIIHAHFGNAAVAYADLAEIEKIPFIVTEHNSKLHSTGTIDKRTLRNALASYAKARSLITVSKSLARCIKKVTGYDSIIVPNIVDTDEFSCELKSREEMPFTYVSAGRIVSGKGMDVLIKAFAKLKSNQTYLIIMGDGPERKSLENLTEDLDIRDRVTFTGTYRRKEFNEILNKSDCFVLPSRGETFGVVYIEAMATGTPVIATKCGGPEEFITDKEGLLVPVDDVDALCNAMSEMIKSIEKYDRTNIAETVKCKYSPEIIAEKLTAIYQEVIL